MTEEFLHFIWKQELHEKNFVADTGDVVEIVSPGLQNTDAGPDFENARIKINGVLWAGNVEIHVDSAGWTRHNHQNDAAYDSVILHVVLTHNKACYRTNGELIPTIELKFDERYLLNYQELIGKNQLIPCNPEIKSVDTILKSIWLDTLCIDRLESKTQYIHDILAYTKGNWEETFYIGLARNFGFKTNSLPFELLAKSIPLKLLNKYSPDIIQLEALLFGQAGLLSDNITDDYYLLLQKEYDYLKKIHQLTPVDKHLWKFLRIRPVNFPTIRLSQFASLINKSGSLFAKTMEISSITKLEELFIIEAGEYWQTHYNFGKISSKTKKPLGDLARSGLIINTIIPFLFLYGKIRGKNEHREKAVRFLEELPAEKNSTITNWMQAGLIPENAMQSQALLQLTGNYCKAKKCLNCQVGNIIIRNTN